MRFRTIELFLGAFLTIAIFSVGMLFSSSYAPQPAQQVSTTKSNEQNERPKNSDSELTGSTWLTKDAAGFFAFVTAIIGAAQAAFFWYQLGLIRKSLVPAESAARAAQVAAAAADRSAKASIALQSPIIRINPNTLSHGSGVADGKPYESCGVHFVTISNLGVTKAFPKEIAYGWTIGNELPPNPSYQWIDSFLPNSILEPDPKVTPRKFLHGQKLLEAGQQAEINKGNCVWFYCVLLYDDFMGDARSHGFCWRWSYAGNGLAWQIEGNPAYNRKS